MKLATFTEGGRSRVGVVEDARIADVCAADPTTDTVWSPPPSGSSR